MRREAANFEPGTSARVHRVSGIDALAAQWTPDVRLLVRVTCAQDKATVARLRNAGLTNISWVDSDALEHGDVVVPQSQRQQAVVLFRERDVHHSLLLTNRCNSYCLMCSQPPTTHDDSWLLEEALDVVRHIKDSPDVLGFSGGEPLLLGVGLRRLLEAVSAHHPRTRVEVLTNGRLLSDSGLAKQLLQDGPPGTTWLVPLYGHADFLHDFVVQAYGAFDETLAGLLNLRAYEQPVQLRIVLIEPVLQVLPELCGFIGRNLPFVREVALMACEPTGFALANRQHCEVDLLDWSGGLEQATRVLQRHRVPFLFMNAPLCALPPSLRRFAHKSISDWKNVYADECERCSVRSDCAGLFAWHESGWKPTKIRAVEGAVV